MEIIKKIFSFLGRFFGVLWGVVFALGGLGGLIAAITEKQPAFYAMVVPMWALAALLLWVSLKKKKGAKRVTAPAVVDAPVLVEDVNFVNVQVVEPVDAYIHAGNMVYRTDGQPISDREVPYLIAQGYQNVLNKEPGPPPDANDDELKFFAALELALTMAKKSPKYTTTRMSSKAIEVRSASYVYLGKIDLKSKTTWMQYPKRNGDWDSLYGGTLKDYIQLIPRWVRIA